MHGSSFLLSINSRRILQEPGKPLEPPFLVQFERRVLQIPADPHRCHYAKTRVRVHRYRDDTLAVFHGPRLLSRYDAQDKPKGQQEPKAAA